METVEILAGGEFANAVKSLGLTSPCVLTIISLSLRIGVKNTKFGCCPKRILTISVLSTTMNWKNDWGWWRHAYGSNLGAVDCAYVINGEKLMAWDGLQRKEWCRDCSDCAGTEKDKDECFHDHQYPDILIYLCDEIGASTERNVCACTIDLARQNNLTLAELFKKYLG